jgi:hypothetical protein
MLRCNIYNPADSPHFNGFAPAWVFHRRPDTVMLFDPADDTIDAD